MNPGEAVLIIRELIHINKMRRADGSQECN